MRKIKRNTVNKGNLTNKSFTHITKICFHINMFCSYIQKRICLQIQKPHSKLPRQILQYVMQEVVYMTIGKPAFCLFLYLTGVHFRGEL